MRLRYQFLTLVLTLLLGVVGGSFYWLYSDLRREFLSNLNTSLDASVSLFRSGETQRYDTLHLLASSLERSPGFRNVLRRTDYETLRDFVADLNRAMTVDLVVVTDDQGKVLLRTDRPEFQEQSLAEHLAVGEALEGYAIRDYWELDSGLYQGVTLPLADSQGYIDGTVTLAYRLDRAFLQRQERKLGARLTLELGEKSLSSSGKPAEEEVLSRQGPLGSNAGKVQGEYRLERSLQPVREFVLRSRGRLVALGGSALLLAVLISVPVIGKLTNPVEQLAQAQAEMATIFAAIPEGLVALDEQGRVSALNPAATVALGWQEGDCLGKNLAELLPAEAHSELLGTPAGLVQQANMEREGHTYRLTRTFVRRAQSEDLGSILILQDATSEQEGQRQLDALLAHISTHLDSPDSPFRVRLALQNLSLWRQSLQGESCRVPVSQLVEACEGAARELGGELEVESPQELELEGDPEHLRLLLLNLVVNALEHGTGPVGLVCRRDGGACEFLITNQRAGDSLDLDGPGLGLPLVRLLVEELAGRLVLETPDEQFRVSLKLPILPSESRDV